MFVEASQIAHRNCIRDCQVFRHCYNNCIAITIAFVIAIAIAIAILIAFAVAIAIVIVYRGPSELKNDLHSRMKLQLFCHPNRDCNGIRNCNYIRECAWADGILFTAIRTAKLENIVRTIAVLIAVIAINYNCICKMAK